MGFKILSYSTILKIVLLNGNIDILNVAIYVFLGSGYRKNVIRF